MKQCRLDQKIICILIMSSIFLSGVAVLSDNSEAAMTDYCVTPPFVVGGVKPNLLMMIDNSSSMYDLNYIAGSLYPPTTFPSSQCTGNVSAESSYCMDDTFVNSKVCSLKVTSCSANSDCPQSPVAQTCSGGICTMPVTTCATDANCPSNGTCVNPYVGYFDTAKFYHYQNYPAAVNSNAATPAASDKFAEATEANVPALCSFEAGRTAGAAPYVCINYNASNNVSAFYARGDFLNWLSASKFDVEKKILTGGKYDTGSSLLTGESRGCLGRRFVKMLRASTYTAANPVWLNITFAVRGPNATDPDNVRQGIDGGITRIEIFNTVNSNMAKCQCAVTQWESGNYGAAKNDTGACINVVNTELSAYNQIIQDCWTIKKNLAAGDPPFGTNDNNPSFNSTKNQCLQVYRAICGSESGGKCSKRNVDPSAGTISDTIGKTCSITTTETCKVDSDCPGGETCRINEGVGYFQCTSAVTHVNPAAPYNYYDTPDPISGLGFLGKCVTEWKFQGNQLDVVWNDACARREILHFCYGAAVAEVTDPSEGPASQGSNIPSILMDSSIRSLGTPKGTFYSRVTPAGAPEGLIHEFSDQIRFGAMAFYSGTGNNGTKSECGVSGSNIACDGYCSTTTTLSCTVNNNCPPGETCTVATKTDGGQVISYIGDSIGDYSSGLIGVLNNLQAKSWTPFAETFYSAIGYYAKDPSEDYPPHLPATGGTSRNFNLPGQTNYVLNRNPSEYRCQRNNILLISDGQSTADRATVPQDLVDVYRSSVTFQTGYDTTNSCPSFFGSRSLDDLSWIAKNRNIRTFSTSVASTAAPENASEYIDTYVVYSGAMSSTAPGQCNPVTLMDATASAGGTGAALKATNPLQLESSLKAAFQKIAAKTASGTAASVLASGEGSGANLIQALFYPQRRHANTDIKWTGVLQNLWYYIDPHVGNSNIREDSNQNRILELDTDPSGDYILQFTFDNNETTANLFADADGDGSIDDVNAPVVSNLTFSDIKYLWESGKRLFERAPGNTNGTLTNPDGNRVIFTNLDNNSTLDAFDTNAAGSDVTLSNSAATISMAAALDVSSSAEAGKLIRYIRGIDNLNGLAVSSALNGDANNDGTYDDPAATIDGVRIRNRTVTIGGTKGVWKLSDIVNATPKIVSWVPINLYDKIYRDTTYKEFTSTAEYKGRGMVFAGANDGMLHAFKLGLLGILNDTNQKATLGKICSNDPGKTCVTNDDCPNGTCTDDPDIGKEVWSFIPKNSLPYLKYLADPDYCHLYYVDATPFVVDVSINKVTDTNDDGAVNSSDAAQPASCDTEYWTCDKYKKSWRTVLIGGMKIGGGCKSPNSTCAECIKPPVEGMGYSSYFALDITDPYNPTLLWEFANPDMGLSTSGPGIVRIGEKSKNGRWFVVFGSGPTGYVSQGQFTAITPYSDSETVAGSWRTMKLYVLDLKTGALLRTINTNEQYGFTGSLVNAAMDFDQDKPFNTGFYKDDAVYFGYASPNWTTLASGSIVSAGPNTVRLPAGASGADNFYTGNFIYVWDGSFWRTKLITKYTGNTKEAEVDSNWTITPLGGAAYNIFPGWSSGGVMRLLTKESLNPNDWVLSRVISGIGPVTSAVAKLQNFKQKNLRLFFGTGRYYFKLDTVIDDAASNRRLFGIVEPCYTVAGFNTACTTTVSINALGNATDEGEAVADGSEDPDGWYINLDPLSSLYTAERLVTEPLAVTTGAVFFTTSQPAAHICEYGGQSHLWAVKYDTGGSLDGTGILRGRAIVQVSTGSIEEVDLSTAFTEKGKRRSFPMQGLPPGGGLSVVIPPKPLDEILHMRKH